MAEAPIARGLDPATRAFYLEALAIAQESEIPFLVGGAYALERYTGIARHTKDLDFFVRPEDAPRLLDTFAAAGFRSELTYPHWLGKAYRGPEFIDVIFRSGNGTCQVDDAWFDRAVPEEVFGVPVRLCPVEEIVWMKAFIMERERFDGADVAHLLLFRGESLDWAHLVDRFGPHWRVLLSHLVLFGFIYPGDRTRIPARVLDDLAARLREEPESPPAGDRLCRGPLLSRAQYLTDLERWGYHDARLVPHGTLTPDQTAAWTGAIGP